MTTTQPAKKLRRVKSVPAPPTTRSVAPAAPPTALPAAAPLRILLVEDNAMDVALISRLLVAAGREISVVSVETRENFETELVERTPHLILSDYSLPTFDGSKALAIAKRIAPHVPFIFVTGTMGEEVAIEMLKRGATDYVLKSRLARLTPAVNRALSESEHRREREQAGEDLRRSHDRLRALTGHLQFVREEERKRIAREVHDELGQALTGLRLDLSWLSGQFRGAREPMRKIKSMSVQLDATIQAIRRIATELRPGVLDSLGLAAAIEWQAAEFQERTGLPCGLKLEVAETIWSPDFSTACFRIFQETLTNIIRHAGATQVEVRLARNGPDVILSVHDDGCGITEKQSNDADSIGLIGMRERATQLGGDVTFVGGPGRGTTVTMRVPFSATVASAESPP